MKTIFPLLAAAASLMLTACAKDQLYRTPHPDLGAVKVATDWSSKGSDVAAPPVYTLRMDGKEHIVGGTTNVFGTLLAPGDYDLAAFSRPERIAVSGNTATVEAVDEAGGIAPDPGYLFSAYSRVHVVADDTVCVTLPMKQLVRRLDIVLTATEGDYTRVVSATATLTGVASAVDITTGLLADHAAATTMPFTREGDTFATSFRLLGVEDTGSPTLTVDFVFDNGSSQTVSTEVPQPSDKPDSGSGSGSALSPNIQVLLGDLRLPVAGEVTETTITDWQLGNGTGEDVGVK